MLGLAKFTLFRLCTMHVAERHCNEKLSQSFKRSLWTTNLQRWLQERAELYARAVRSDQAHAELNQTVADQDQRLACLQGDADALASCSAEEIERCLQVSLA